MSANDPRQPRGEGGQASEGLLRELFAHARPRPAPPEKDAAEIRQAVFAEWDAVTGRRVLLRRIVAGAAASLAIVGLAFVTLGDRPIAPAPTVAHVERVRGAVEVADARGTSALRIGEPLAAGSTVSTGEGYAAVRIAGGSLRLAPRTRVTLSGVSSAELRSGAVYFDSEAQAGTSLLVVVTAAGTVRDVGTQYFASLVSNRLEVGVRDGRVDIDRSEDRVSVTAGELVAVAEGAAGVRRERIETFGGRWEWAEQLAPPFDIDGHSLMEFLTWVSEQTGRAVVFADPAAERTARGAVLSGSIDLDPLPKLAAVLTLTDLRYTLEGGRIVIGSAQ